MLKKITFDDYLLKKTKGMTFTYPEFRVIQNSLEPKFKKLNTYLLKREHRTTVKSEECMLLNKLNKINKDKRLFDTLKITHKRVYDMIQTILCANSKILFYAENALKSLYPEHYRDRNRTEPISKDVLYFVDIAVKTIKEDSSLSNICACFVWSYTTHPEYKLHQNDIDNFIKFLDKYNYSMDYSDFENMIFSLRAQKLLPTIMKKYNFYPQLADHSNSLVDIYHTRGVKDYYFNAWDDVAQLLIDNPYNRNSKNKIIDMVSEKCSKNLSDILFKKYIK